MKTKIGCRLAVLALLLINAPIRLHAQNEGVAPEGQAQLISFEDLAYPGIARTARVQGIVVVKAELDEKGNVITASALTVLKPLIADCLENVKKWKFKPNSGKSALIVYEFKLDEGACHDASHSLFRLVHPNFVTVVACNPIVR